MALTAETNFDVIGQTQTITFFQSSSQVDQVSFGSNQITFQSTSQYNLTKSDYLLWFQYLFAFYNLLSINFPSISFLGKWPLCQFDITESSSGVTHLIYTQASQGTNVLVINYVPVAGSAGISARGSPVTISLTEFYMTIDMLQQYTRQVSQN